jgi:pectin methylesterase-like acyl-CoA thioesterase/lysophospholipase L1-like esterase
VPLTVPGTPSSGKATVTAGVVTVSWSPTTGATGYLVCKRIGDEDDARSYQLWNPTTSTVTGFGDCGKAMTPVVARDVAKATSFVDRTVTEGQVAYYRVYAWNAKGQSSSYSGITATNPMVAPAQVAGVRAQAATGTDPHGLVVSWTAGKETDLAGYTVTRASTSSGVYAVLGTVPAGTTTFADTSAPRGAAVYYRVTATDRVGNVSKVSSTVSGTSTTAPAALAVTYAELTVDPARPASATNFTTVSAAVASVPSGNLTPTRITIAAGRYHETFRVTSPYLTLRGATGEPRDVVIEYDKASGLIDPTDGKPYGTAGSYTVFVDAAEVTFEDLTVQNSFQEAAVDLDKEQAVALRVEGNHFVGDHLRILGNQDTLLADTPKPTTRIRQYYVNSFIEGDVDYVFGAATAVFDNVVFHSLDRGKTDNGAITAASTDTGNKYGFLIKDSKVISEAAAGTVHLGRPWHPSADPDAIAQVAWTNTWLPAAIATAQPWEDMSSTDASGTKVNFTWQSARFSEYANTGPGAGVNANRPQLTAKDALNYTPAKYLAGSDGWDPTVAHPADVPAVPAAPTGLVGTGDDRAVHLAWDESAAASVVGWVVQRSAPDGSTTDLASVSSASWTDSTVVPGQRYAYRVLAVDRAGHRSAQSAAVTVTAVAAPLVTDLVVDPAATPDATHFRTIGAALAAAPAGTTADPTVISVAAGRYPEYLTVATSGVVLVGATGDATDVVVTGNRAAGTPLPDGSGTYGTSGSATVVITASNVQFRDLTVENAYVEGTYPNGQAVALRTTGDRLVFDGVRLLGNQDTLYVNSANATAPARSYFHDSYIEGDVDFLFGRGTAVFDRSTLVALEHGTNPNGAVTAASTDRGNGFGFLITDSRVTGTAPDGSQNLGRPWQPGVTQADGTSVRNTSALAQVVVRDSWLGPVVRGGEVWTSMVNSGYTTTPQEARFAEYGNTGPGAVRSGYAPQLSDAEAARYTAETYLAGTDGWNPVRPPAADVAPAAVTGLVGTGADKKVTLSWRDSVEADVVGYRVSRSTGTTADPAAPVLATVTKASFLDATAKNGTTYTYSVAAVDAAGNAGPAVSATVTANPAPLVPDAVVAADGSGDFTGIAAALAALPAGTATDPTVVAVAPGTYREVVSSAKPYLTLFGTTGNAADVVLTYDNANGTATGPTTCPAVATATCGTSGSATLTLTGANVTVRDLTVQNTFDRAAHPEIGPNNTQAVALRATGDKQVYAGVRLLGVQDTLLADGIGNISADGSGYPRQYYVDSVVQGNVDYVFGRATAVFDSVTFVSTAKNGGTLFAPSTASKAKGYLVVDSRFTSANDPGTFYLGRPWRAWGDLTQKDDSRGQTVIRDSWLAAGFATAQPWTDFAPNAWTDGRFAEHGNTGPGATVNAKRPQLSDADAAAATPAAWLAGADGWDPVVDRTDTVDAAPAAPVVTAAPGDAAITLSWAESPEADVVGYRVHRVTGTTRTLLTGPDLTAAGYTAKGLTNGVPATLAVTAVDAAGHESASAEVTATPQVRVDAVVAADGSSRFATLQAAIDAAPAAGPWVVQVQPGTYAGATTIGKSGITVFGAGGDRSAVVLTGAGTTGTLSVTGSSVTVRGLTVSNTATSGNAPAVSMTGDKVLLQDVALSSGSVRAVFADVPTTGATSRQMIEASTVTGTGELLFGRATLVVHGSTLVPTKSSALLATPATTADGGHGVLVIGSTIAPATGVTDTRFARPYNQSPINGQNNPEFVVRDSVLTGGVKSTPWQDFVNGAAVTPWTAGRFAEFGNTGAGAVTAATDARPQLTPADSVSYTVQAWLGAGDWYPAVAAPATPADVSAPAAPAVPETAVTAAGATLTWAANTEADLAGYRLYRSTTAPVALTTANRVGAALLTGTTATDAGLTGGTTYRYALVAVDRAGNVSAASTVTVTPADVTPPAVPAGVTGVGAESRVVLSWTASAAPDLAGYQVYRAGADTPLNRALLTTTTYTELGLTNGTAYGYEVSAVDLTGNESARSTAVSVTPVEGDAEAPAAPNGLRAVLGKRTVDLSWSAVPDVDVAGYDVWRATAGGDFAKLTATPVTSPAYTDTTGTVGTAYSYVVTAVDASRNVSDRSAAVTATPVAADLVVAKDGTGDFTTVQAAIDALPNNSDAKRTVLVRPGTYPGFNAALAADGVTRGNRYNVSVVGAGGDPRDVVLTGNGASATGTVNVTGDGWTLRRLTVANTNSPTPSGSYGTALSVVNGDRHVFEDVRFLGDYRTLSLGTASTTTYSRAYFRNAYVEGGSDMVFGRALAVFDRSTVHVLNRGGASVFNSTVAVGSTHGFLLTDSTVLADGNPGSLFLARPNGSTSSQTVVRSTALPAAVNTAQPWRSDTVTWDKARFAEYQNTGPGAAVPNPATRPQLSAVDAAKYTKWAYLAGADGWNPTGETAPVVTTDTTAPAAPALLTGTPGAGTVELDWADSAEPDLAGYRVYRAVSASGPWAQLTGTTLTGSSFTDTTMAIGSASWYRVTALDTTGNESDVAAVSTTVTTPPATTRPVSVFVAGDSTASVYATDEAPRAGWGQALSQFASSNATIVDYAQSGASTKSYIADGLLARVLREIKPGDYLLVSFGHNDEKTDDPNRGTDPSTTFTQNLQRFIDGARAKGATPVLVTPVERRQFSGGHAVATHGAYPAAMRTLGAAAGVPVVDLQASSLAAFEQLGAEGTKSWFLNLAAGQSPNYPNGVVDNTHFQAKGALELARLVMQAVQDQQVLPSGGAYTDRLADPAVDPASIVWPARRPV